MPELQTITTPATASSAGLRLIGVNETRLPVVRFGITVPHGTTHDAPGRSGQWRSTLEMLVRGCAGLDRAQFADALETLGSAIYATAGPHVSLIRGITLRRNWPATAKLLRQALNEPLFCPTETRQLIEETTDELAQARDDDATVAEIFWRRLLFEGHPFARSPAGEPEDLARADADQLSRQWRQRWSTAAAGSMCFVFAGDLQVEEAAEWAVDLRQDCSEVSAFSGPAAEPVPPTGSGRLWLVDKPGRVQSQIRLGCLVAPQEERQAMALWLGVVAFGGVFTSPFVHEIRDVRGWSYGSHASYDRMSPGVTPLTLSTEPSTDDTVDCLRLMHQMWGTLVAGDLAEETLGFTRDYLLNRFPFRVATADAVLWSSMAYVFRGLSPDRLAAFPQVLESITFAEVRAALTAALSQAATRIVVVGDAERLASGMEGFCAAEDFTLSRRRFREPLVQG